MQKNILFATLLILIGAPFAPATTTAWWQIQEWPSPVNISSSGAASQPRLLATSDGQLQAFWWDEYDGLMSAVSEDGKTWSEPTNEQMPGVKFDGMPTLITDGSNWVHAFWIETKPDIQDPAEERNALLYSQTPFGQSAWSLPATVAQSAMAYDLALSSNGELHLAYLRTKHTPLEPAGVYFKKNSAGGVSWSLPVQVQASIYFRMLTNEQANIQIISASSSSQGVSDFILWDDPRIKKTLLTFSTDHGDVWSEPQTLDSREDTLGTPRLAPIPRPALVWQAPSQRGCAIYRQELFVTGGEGVAGSLEIGSPEPIMVGLSECPQGEQYLRLNDRPLWVWGAGSAGISLVAWDTASKQWSLPNRLSVAFQAPETGQVINLGDLQPALVSNQLTILGDDAASGDVWLVMTKASALQLAYAGPSPWSELQPLAQDGVITGTPAIALDAEGRSHAVWSLAPDSASPGTALFYAQYSQDGAFGPQELVPAIKGEIARQPAMLYDSQRGILHLAWSGGADGALLYSWVGENEAGSPAAWSTPQTLAALAGSAYPQIAEDTAGNLFVVFVVPLNEERSVYLVHSEDHGSSWSEPQAIFNASQAGWEMVDQPTLALSPDGSLHVAWVQARTPGLGEAQAIHYTYSHDNGLTWSLPLTLTGPGFTRPRLAYANGQLHLLYAAEAGGRSGIYHRYVAPVEAATQSSAWSAPSAIPGWQMASLAYGLAAADSLYLLGADVTAGNLNYAAWDGQRWTAVEQHAEIGLVAKGLAASAAVSEAHGRLAIGWLAYPASEEAANPSLFLLARQIPMLTPPSPTAEAGSQIPTPSLTPNPSPAPTLTPSPTPDLNQVVAGRSLPLPPLALGGLLAAVLVVAAFAGSAWLGRSRPSLGRLVYDISKRLGKKS